MPSVFTNRFKAKMLEVFTRKAYSGGALPTNLFIFLATSAVAPTVDTNTKSELTEIAAGNGYVAGGQSLDSVLWFSSRTSPGRPRVDRFRHPAAVHDGLA